MDKKMFARMLCLAVGLSVYPACAKRVELPVLRDTASVDLLTTAELAPGDLALPAWDNAFGVRMLASAWLLLEKEEQNTRIQIYRGERETWPCTYSGFDEWRCHRTQLLIGIATTGDHPIKKVYQLPPALHWEEPKIVQYGDATSANSFIELSIKESFPGVRKVRGEAGNRAFVPAPQERERRLFINIHEGYLQ